MEENGAPLSDSEAADMTSPNDLAAGIDSILPYLDAHPDSYAGKHIDQSRRGILYVGFTRDQTAHLSALQQQFPTPENIRVFDATYTLAELTATMNQIADDLPALSLAGTDIRSVAVNEEHNRVEVGVVKPAATAEANLQLLYSKSVRVIDAPNILTESDRTNTRPRRDWD